MAKLVLFLLVSVFVAASGHVSKRSDDTVPYAVEVQQLAANYNQLTAQFTALQNELTAVKSKIAADERRVAFLAQFSAIEVTTPTSGPFHFDHALFNDGGSYDASLGVFTAPYSGVYSIQVKLYQDGQQTAHLVFDVMLNGHLFDRMAFGAATLENNSQPQSSHTTAFTMRMSAGDKVWVQGYAGRTYTLYGGTASYFSGALLYAD